jgi:nicotinate-nucleotide--dimethylbenzimidazole phosphoribosyltransferase
VTLQPLLDAVLVDLGGTVVEEAPPATAVTELPVRFRPGAIDDLVWIAGQVRLGAVTNTATMTEPHVRALLEPSGVDGLLEVLITSVDAGAAKPDPRSLLTALELLGLVDPGRVLYIGDQPTDAEAAAGAGMPYVDVGDGTIAAAVHGWIERTAGEQFEAARGRLRPSDPAAGVEATAHQARLTKPLGSLGRLEAVSVQLAAIARTSPPPVPEPAVVVVFAADHGVLASGVSPWPQEVTAQMVANFCAGGAAINVLARHVGARVEVIDVGVATALQADLAAASPVDLELDRLAGDDAAAGPDVVRRKVAAGTADLAAGPAMNRTQVLLALDVGVEAASRAIASGARCLLTGDMGIGNTTPSAAIIAAITGRPPAEVTGRGAGADDAVLARKIEVIERALERVQATAGTLTLLEEVGGLEIAALAGLIIGGAAAGVPVLIDGVIAAAAALIAVSLCPDSREYLFAGHRSVEPGSSAALAHLGLDPLLDLELRLGEGSGAALALPVLQAAAKVLREMATFDSAGVTEK